MPSALQIRVKRGGQLDKISSTVYDVRNEVSAGVSTPALHAMWCVLSVKIPDCVSCQLPHQDVIALLT